MAHCCFTKVVITLLPTILITEITRQQIDQESRYMKKTVLIAGASVAGLTMAYWLNHYGYNFSSRNCIRIKKGGAAIDVRGEALHVAAWMNILDKITAKKITTVVAFVDAQNKCLAAIINFGEDNLKQDIQLNRDDLTSII